FWRWEATRRPLAAALGALFFPLPMRRVIRVGVDHLRAADTRLQRLMWVSISAAVATISLKTLAWALTGSVGLLSDAAESVVNLVAAVFGLVVLHWSQRPADEEHAYGHE